MKANNTNINKKTENILKACAQAIYCSKGSFYPDKDYGSNVRDARGNARLLYSFASAALANIDGVYLNSASVSGGNAVFDVIINGESRQVVVEI